MITTEKLNAALMAYWFTAMLVILVLGRYGRQAVEWVLVKLYEVFIQRT